MGLIGVNAGNPWALRAGTSAVADNISQSAKAPDQEAVTNDMKTRPERRDD
jgi:hypothetical protein